MDEKEIDFEGTVNKEVINNNADTQNKNINTEQDKENLDSNDNNDITEKDGNNINNEKDSDSEDPSTGELNIGDSIEFDGKEYIVDDKGNLVDSEGNVFKEAKDIKEWLKSVDIEENTDNSNITIENLQESLGIEITDENGKPIEFTNDTNGIKAYVDAVIELKSNELQEAAINRLYSDNPLLKQFQDYVQINGTAHGFGDIPDRSKIQLDKENEAQQVAIIKLAAVEFGNKTLNDNYIKYLKNTGSLYEEARNQLDALVEKDNNYRKEIEIRAEQIRKEEAESLENYWKAMKTTIDSRNIVGYKLPESFTKEVNGKKIILTPNDFFDYISKQVVDSENNSKITGYQRDLNKLSDEEYRNRELLDAWLLFTGGTYKDLIDMAVKEDEVRKLKLKSKEQRTIKPIKITKKAQGKVDINDILF